MARENAASAGWIGAQLTSSSATKVVAPGAVVLQSPVVAAPADMAPRRLAAKDRVAGPRLGRAIASNDWNRARHRRPTRTTGRHP